MSDGKSKSVLDGVPITTNTHQFFTDKEQPSRLSEPVFSAKHELTREAKRLRHKADRLDKLAEECDKLSSESAETLLSLHFATFR